MEPVGETTELRTASVRLCLFVAGTTGPSARARKELEALRVELEGDDWSVEVVDVLERPYLAEEARIVATPVLVRVAPLPRRSIIGDLSDWQAVAEVLELRPGRGGRRESDQTGGG